MRTVPILYNTEMVISLKKERKHKTRRLLKKQPVNSNYPFVDKIVRDWNHNFYGYSNDSDIDIFNAGKCPYGQIGDILWVRETWHKSPSGYPILYKADFPMKYQGTEWDPNKTIVLESKDYKFKPSIHMPKNYARIFLEITNVRVEKLQDITAEEAIKEGIIQFEDGLFKNYLCNRKPFACPIESFKSLWQSIEGPASWHQNPWIWVIDFKRTERPVNF